jgi:hypothetical protein
MSQIEKHSKIAVGLRQGGIAQENKSKSNSHVTQSPIEQLQMFSE